MAIYDAINSNVKISQGINLSTYMKAIKTDSELENIKKAYILDGVSLVKFFIKIHTKIQAGTLLYIIEFVYHMLYYKMIRFFNLP